MSLTNNLRNVMTDEDNKLIADFLKNKKITACPPAAAGGNEMPPSSVERITALRKVFRENHKAKMNKK